jgi:hypothetical protein
VQGPNTLAIKAKVLGKRLGDQDVQGRVAVEVANSPCVSIEVTSGETLTVKRQQKGRETAT